MPASRRSSAPYAAYLPVGSEDADLNVFPDDGKQRDDAESGVAVPLLDRNGLQQREHFSTAKLILLTICMAGTQFAWAAQNGMATKTFREAGMKSSVVSLAFLAGPISGIIVQPIVGAWSDNIQTRLGRRRPFLIAGAVAIAFNMLLFAYGTELGVAWGDPSACDENKSSVKEGQCPRSLGVLVVAFWLLDFALNAVQGPARALLADVLPPDQHEVGNAWFAFMISIGNLVGYGLGSVDLTDYLSFFVTNLRALYIVCGAACVGCVILTSVTIHEPVFVPQSTSVPRVRGVAVLKKLPRSFVQSPKILKRCFAVQCTTWFAFFMTFIYYAAFVGESVYGGIASDGTAREKDIFNEGVRLANLGLAIQSAVAALYSFSLFGVRSLVVQMIDWLGSRRVYVLSQVVQGVSLALAPAAAVAYYPPPVHARILAVLVIALSGITWATTMTVPWSLVSRGVADSKDSGMLLAVFNLSQCIPEIFASLLGSAVVSIFGSLVSPLVLAGIVAFAGAPLIVWLRVGE